MVGLVIVSHSARLAEGVVELARAMAGPDVPIEAAGGIDEPGELGTDAVRVMEAIDRAGGGGVIVLMDLGSAVLSAETALDLLPADQRERVMLCEAPIVEGAVAAAAAAGAGGTLEDVAREARAGLAGKVAHLGGGPGDAGGAAGEPADEDGWTGEEAVVGGRHGLHARPAAAVVRAAADAEADVRLRNLTAGRGPASARSLTGLATLGALAGHRVMIEARGAGARQAVATIRAIVEDRGDVAPAPAPLASPGEAARAPAPAPERGDELRGVPAAPGRGLGPARVLTAAVPELPDAPAGDPPHESEALRAALGRAAADLEDLRTGADREAAEILAAQILLTDDAGLTGPAERAIASGAPAARAFHDAVRDVAAAYEGLDDEYMRARRDDVLDLGRRVVALLAGSGDPGAGRDGVIVADELGAAEVAALDPAVVTGLATAGGGPTSHASIIARSLGIPAVAGLGPRVLRIAPGTPLIVDGDTGAVVVDPGPDALRAHEAHGREEAARAAAAAARAHERAVTSDGHAVEVAANIGAPGDLEAAVAAGADGVGLLRTEFLFLDRRDAPGEDEQRAAYAAAVDALGGRRLVLRTLDAGADKPLPYLGMPPEANPFLGVRGLRLSLARPELLAVQLRAALAAAAGGPMSIMFPMVSELGELREARRLLDEAREALARAGAPCGEVEVGAMVEVPAVAMLAEAIAPEVDFLSIGTNDLVQYTMAAERGNGGVARLSDPVHPAVLRLIARVAEAAAEHGTRVAVCGEAASDPLAIPLLVGLGVRELSVAPPRVGLVKQRVREIDHAASADLARRALALADAAAVRRLVAGDG